MASWSILNPGTGVNIHTLTETTVVSPTVDEVIIYDNSATENRRVVVANLGSVIVGDGLVPAGSVLVFAMQTPPDGWLPANGAAVSRSTYAALFAAIADTYGAGDASTTFNVPDLRGYFVRGYGTNSDGAVSGTFGTKVSDTFASHQHTTPSDTNPGAIYAAGAELGGSTVAGSSVTGLTGGTETKPKNIAMLYCIKY